MENREKHCPFCGSNNILPFEDENSYKKDHTFLVIILSALILIGSYFIFVISSYLYFPAVIIILIIISTTILNKREKDRGKKIKKIKKEDYICIDCNSTFKL